jgi:hypothetical protein
MAADENSDYGNNSTGTLISLFQIGPEAAATASTPQGRLPAIINLVRGPSDRQRLLGLKAISASLDCHGMGYRTVGLEFQGMRQRVVLWKPTTYAELWEAKRLYLQTLVDESRNWTDSLRQEAFQVLLDALREHINTPPCTELAFEILERLIADPAVPPGSLNRFFWEPWATTSCAASVLNSSVMFRLPISHLSSRNRL